MDYSQMTQLCWPTQLLTNGLDSVLLRDMDRLTT